MPGHDDDRAKQLADFKAVISGLPGADLHSLLGKITAYGRDAALQPARPELRRVQLDAPHVFRVRMDLRHATPPIWRRIDLRSDLSLADVHQVIQAAFGWTDSHLHRFAIGGGPFDAESQVFLCPYDVEEGEPDDGGIAAAEVHLDETMQEPGDVLAYVYDYGDSWELRIQLEEVRPADDDAPSAAAVDGRRAAPPEDCGGLTDAADLAQVLDDPAALDLDEINDQLRSTFGVDKRLLRLVRRLAGTAAGDDLERRLAITTSLPTTLSADEVADALRPVTWFLDRAADGGIPLTAAGYMKPAVVVEAALVVPAVGGWIGKNNREDLCYPLHNFRLALQQLGLLRKHKSALLLSRAAAAARTDPYVLWHLLAGRLVPAKPAFDVDAALMVLLFCASSEGEQEPFDRVAAGLTLVGYQHVDGAPINRYELGELAVAVVLENLTAQPQALGELPLVSPAAAALARAAVRRR